MLNRKQLLVMWGIASVVGLAVYWGIQFSPGGPSSTLATIAEYAFLFPTVVGYFALILVGVVTGSGDAATILAAISASLMVVAAMGAYILGFGILRGVTVTRRAVSTCQ